ncbi:MAG TPA: hypothetical protein VGC13_19065 [Longimicrobium sp.]|jgi:hypothetical protein|uniref:hypothetical protein n=1 Tax=Longimicrobium sp. TaxID=2029185 RepID=UPI002EDB91FD
MQTATQILSDFRQGRLDFRQLASQAGTCNDQVTLQNWSVQLNSGDLVSALEVVPNSGYSISLLITGVMSQDQSQLYTAQLASVPNGPAIAGPVSALTWTALFPGGSGTTVMGAVLGILDSPDGTSCTFSFQQEFQV